jgi:hypothetical protein
MTDKELFSTQDHSLQLLKEISILKAQAIMAESFLKFDEEEELSEEEAKKQRDFSKS